jgi:hypothetical protein
MTLMTTQGDVQKPPRPTWFKVKRKLPFLLEFGTVEDAITLAKLIDPNVSEEQQKRIAKLFHDAKLARARSQ